MRSRHPPRLLLLGIGWFSLAAAALGVVLPLLPATPFLLLAAWAFGRASPALRDRLHADPRFGPLLRDWERHGAIGRRAKRAALAGMALSWLLLVALVRSTPVAALAGACMAAVAAYVLTRPAPPGERGRPVGGGGRSGDPGAAG